MPKQIYIDITDGCNLKCIHCYANSGKKKPFFIPFELVSKLIDSVSGKGVEIIWLLGGEPLIHPDFFKIVKKIKSKKINPAVITNATLIDKRLAKKFKKAGVSCVQISIDSFNPETHDLIRGVKGSFEKSFNAIQFLIEEGVNVSIITTLMKQNLSEAREVINWCLISGIGCTVNAIFPSGRASQKLYPKRKDFVSFVKELPEADFTNKSKKSLCGVGFEKIAIDSRGNIFPCSIMRNFVLGNIKSDDLVGVFNNHPVMKEIRASTVDKIKECRKCPARERCLGGCKQRVFAMHGRFNAPDDVQCVVFKKNHKLKLEHPENFPLK